MNILVTVDKNWAIGNQGQLLVSIPEDQRLLREETQGGINVILSKDRNYQVKGAVVCHSLEETLDFLKQYSQASVFIIGGSSIYDQFLPYCDTVHATFIDYEYSADTHFPDLDKSGEWSLTAESDEHTYFNLCYSFRMYQKK